MARRHDPDVRMRAAWVVAALLSAAPSIAQAPAPDHAASKARVESLLQQMTMEEKIGYIGGNGSGVRGIRRLGLPPLEMSDGPYGVRSNEGLPSTAYPAGIGLAATWNRALAEQVGAGIGKDARARGIHFMLGPGLNIYRSPLNGRNFEYFGEDPYLASQIAVPYISGMQKQGVSATAKHFVGNNSEFLRHDSNSVIGERALHEIYLPAFESAVKVAHVGAVMDSYNLTNGLHMTQNAPLNAGILRNEWGFDGVLMSDWDSTYDAVQAANSGLDLEMPTAKYMDRTHLLPALGTGKVTPGKIDEKVLHILTTAERFGWLDRQQAEFTASLLDEDNREVALQAARESIVLLKNVHGLLPLDPKKVQSVFVVGPDAYPAVPVGGGSADVKPFSAVSILEGLSRYPGMGGKVTYRRGIPTLSDLALSTDFVTAANGGEPGLNLEVFQNSDLSGVPSLSRVVKHVHSNGVTWQSYRDNPMEALALFGSGPRHLLSRRWSGFYLAPSPGKYTIALQGDGEGERNRASIDGEVLIDNWKFTKALQPYVTVEFAAGPHRVVVETSQNSPVGGRLQLAIVREDGFVAPEVQTMAARADVVLVAAGFDPDSEGEGSDRTFALPFGQSELIEAVLAANKNVIVCVTSGGNVDGGAWLERVPGYLEAWYPGEQGGTALAEVLFGATDPSGHLPATFERRLEENPTSTHYYPDDGSNDIHYSEGIFVGYRGYEHDHQKPSFPFGFGLSYTSFAFSNMVIKPLARSNAGNFTVSFEVTNTGLRAGSEVAQLYISETHPQVERPPKELKGFEKVYLAPGETKRLTITLGPRAFAYYEPRIKGWTISAGTFQVLVGGSSESAGLTGVIHVPANVANQGSF